jgi:hypothetical protein
MPQGEVCCADRAARPFGDGFRWSFHFLEGKGRPDFQIGPAVTKRISHW